MNDSLITTFDAVRTVVCSLIQSHVVYCNCLFASLPVYSIDRLQLILNSAARLVRGLRKLDHVTPALCDQLHWLPKPYIHTNCTFWPSYGCTARRHHTSPSCSSLFPLSTLIAGCILPQLVSSYIPRSETEFGKKAFSFAGQSVRNSQPTNVKLCNSTSSFHVSLKTFLICVAYSNNH